MNFTESLTNHIDKIVGILKDEEELIEVLKRKFTKKEYKVFVAFEEGNSLEDVKKLVGEEEDRINELYKSACKKLNQEKIKQELCDL